MANGITITEENLITSTAKLTRRRKAVTGSLADIGTVKLRPYRLLVRGATAFPGSNPISYVKGATPKREPFIVKQSHHPSDPSTPHQRRSTTIIHPFQLQSPP
jgi:hypothetical protein